MLYPLKKLAKTTNEMETRYIDVKNNANRITKFEDSLIYNSDFRSKTLGSMFTRAEFDSAIVKNRSEVNNAKEDVERLLIDRNRLKRNFNIYKGIDQLLNLLTAVAAGLMIFFWIKLKN